MVAVKPMVEAMGLDWKTQHRKILAHPVLSKGMVIMTIPSEGGPQEVVCLPLAVLPGWQMTINANEVKPELRDTVIAYQTEASAVLFRHFFGNGNLPAAVLARLDQMNERLSAIEGGYDGRRKRVKDFRTMAEILKDQRVAKPWKGIGVRCRARLDRYSKSRNLHDVIRVDDGHIYQYDFVRAWLADEGDQIIRAHNDAQRGQGVLKLVDPPSKRQLKPVPRLRELPPSVRGPAA
jgi:hypothetical protein